MNPLKIIPILLLLGASPSMAAMPAPFQPPPTNPHPPQTEDEKARVNFANQVIERLLMLPQQKTDPAKSEAAPPSKAARSVNIALNSAISAELDKTCLADATCYGAKQSLMNQTGAILQKYGRVKEYTHTHIIPWSWQKYQNGLVQPRPSTGAFQARSEAVAADMEDMPVPVVNKGEYLIHTYVLFESGAWHDLDLVVSEDAYGVLRFQRFFVVPERSDSRELPPGTVC